MTCGVPYIAEAANGDTGEWIYDASDFSEHYNHSSFVDLVLTGLLGIRPQATDSVQLKPLVPDSWTYFAVQGGPVPHPERALRSAKRLETLAPAAGHLVHMPAHIYQRTGNYAGAALLYGLVDPRWHLGDPASQIDGGFDRESDLPPLGWEYNRTLAWRGARAGETHGSPRRDGLDQGWAPARG